MNKYLKYATRAIIIFLPTLLTIKSYMHLKTCRVHKDCAFCWLSCYWFVTLFIVLVALGITWIIINWDEIWSYYE